MHRTVPLDCPAPFPDFPMSTYQFAHEEGERKVSVSFKEIYCPDIVENFYYFMVGCGFSAKNVMNAMEATIDNVRPTISDVD